MEIRIDNTINIKEVDELKILLDDFFNIDFSVSIEGTYTYFRDR